MTSRLIGTALVAVAVALIVLPAQGQRRGRGGPPAPKRAVIVTGENSFNGHVWKDTSAELKKILDEGKAFAEVVIQEDPNFIASPEFLTFDVAVFDFRNANPLTQQAQVEANLLRFLGQPKGLVTIHWAAGAFPYWPEYLNIVGRAQVSVHDPRGPFTVRIANSEHPITRGLQDYEADDELYWDTKEGNRTIVPLAMAKSKIHYTEFPMAHTVQYGRTRVFNTPMGHDVRALQVPGTAELIRRGAAWSGNLLQ
jgi:type 1 glutamine amidotransferase